jgi:ribosome modulation factor
MSYSDFLDRCWQSGYNAYEGNITLKSCPLAKGSPAREAWNQGWEKARHEYEDSPPND